ncbi:MAG: hypothetical protein HC913_20680 [Microscillaceae bacterium]|nr:hypothetical protein [Microscillaceae bacterium]
MNSEQEKEKAYLQNIIAQALAQWQKMGRKRAELVNRCREWHQQTGFKQALAISEASLSKIVRQGEGNLGTMLRIGQALKALLEQEGYGFENESGQFIPLNPDANLTLPPAPLLASPPFDTLAGIYEMYHLTYRQQHILKNILKIDPSGALRIRGIHGHHYQGQAQLFGGGMLALNITQTGLAPFFYQVLAYVGGFAEYGGGLVRHLVGISTTISLEKEPMANLRVLVRVGDYTQPLEHYAPANIALDSAEYQSLQAQYPGLGDFLTQHRPLFCPWRVNDPGVIREQ